MNKKRTNNPVVALLIVVLLLMIAFVLWGVTRDERWVLYTDASGYVEHASFASHEQCEKGMKLFDIPAGCKRVDGIFGILNDGLDLVFR